MLKYYVEPVFSPYNENDFANVFRLSNVDYEIYDSQELGILTPPNNDCYFFVTYQSIIDIAESGFSNLENWLEKFFKNNSYLILNQPYDSAVRLCDRLLVDDKISLFEKYKERILFFYSGTLELEIKTKLKKFNLVKRQETEPFLGGPDFYYNKKIQDLSIKRENKFLLTMKLKSQESRPHRPLLHEYLVKNNLLSQHIGRISQPGDGSNWVGNTFASHDHLDEIISWDLYNQAAFEIVPEVRCKNFSYISEKTMKAVIAKIPFLILSNAQFYIDFKNLGFKTFDSLIDESFAYETDLNLRVEKMINTVKYILDNNALEFYNAAKEICEYNFDHLFYVKSKDRYTSYMSLYNFEQHLNIQN